MNMMGDGCRILVAQSVIEGEGVTGTGIMHSDGVVCMYAWSRDLAASDLA